MTFSPRELRAAVLALACSACGRDSWEVGLRLIDEDGRAVSSGTVLLDGEEWEADADGVVSLSGLRTPELVLAGGPGFFDEPVPIGPEDADGELEITLLSGEGRRVLHLGGDVMMGRRYLAPDEGEPLLRAGQLDTDARSLVSELAPALGAADLTIVNLETVLGDGDPELAYPGKRWLLASPPETIDGLEELGVDLVTLGNNHLADWMDEGVVQTLDALDARDMPAVGAGLDRERAEAPVVLDLDGMTVGVLSATSVDGTFVNDQYPLDEDVAPTELAEEETWIWERRGWGWADPDGLVEIPTEDRRIGSAWRELAAAESDLEELGEDELIADLWASAREVYPELQDWVARRGHGGAALWDPERGSAAITDLAAETDLVVAQLHMGFQFSAAPAAGARQAAQAAADAGADLVILHHPHVLQGVEWIGDTLVIYSLGNLVFDQNFLSTFGSGFLRVVVEEDGDIVQARFVPAWLDAYRPTPVTGTLADTVLHSLWERSMQGLTAERGADGQVRAVDDGQSDSPDARAPAAVLEHHTLRFTDEVGDPTTLRLELSGEDAVPVDRGLLLRTPVADVPDLELGRGLIGLGDFENADTDVDEFELIGWLTYEDDAHLTDRDASSGRRALELVARPDGGRTTARALARAAIPDHRVFADADGFEPLDGTATYSVRLRAWSARASSEGLVRVALYHFDDLDPTRAPDSILMDEISLPFSVSGSDWQTVELALPAEGLVDDSGLRANMALIYLSATEPDQRTALLRVDELELIEWRAADEQPELWARADFLRGPTGTIELAGLSGEPR